MQKLLVLFFLVSSYFSWSQEKFVLVSTGTKYSSEEIIKAFKNAEFCGSFYESKRNKIILDDGAIIELLSKAELTDEKIILSEHCFLKDDTIFQPSLWAISENGHLTKGFDSRNVKYKK